METPSTAPLSEDALRAGEARLREVQRIARLGNWDLDLVHDQLYWSEEIFRIFEVPAESFAASYEAFLSFVHPDDREAVDRAYTESVRLHQPYAITHRLRFPDGRIKFVHERCETFYDPQGNPLRSVGTVQDITDRVEAERALRIKETAIATSINAIAMADLDLRVTYVNQAFLNLWGYDDAGEVLGRPPMDFSGSEERITELLQDLREKHRWTGEIVARRRDGSTFIAQVSAHVVADLDGTPVCMMASFLDVTEREQAMAALRESEERFRATFNQAAVGIAHVAPDGRWLRVNSKLCDILGYGGDELSRMAVQDLTHPGELAVDLASMRQVLDGEIPSFSRETRYFRKGGEVVWAQITVALVQSALHPPGYFIYVVEDISARKAVEAERSKLSSAVEQAMDSILVTDRNGIIEYVNPAFERTTGYSREEALGKKPNLVKSGKHGPEFYRRLWETILAGEVFRDVFINRRKDGTELHEERTIMPLVNSRGEITHFIATGRDITERMQTDERMWFLAHHDTLTALPNRAFFLERLRDALGRARWLKRPLAVMFLDLDRFKTINDSLGHDAGDRLLQAIAQRVKECLRGSDLVGRLGGDEFAVLLPEILSRDSTAEVAERILAALETPFAVDERELFVSASIGASHYPEDGEDSSTLLRLADMAMYRAKEAGRGTYCIFSPEIAFRSENRLDLESALRHALQRKELVVLYQPQVDLASYRITGLEALLRWRHPTLGFLTPQSFIHIAEDTSLVVSIGEWVLQTAAEQASSWSAAGFGPLTVSVNLSARQFNDPALVARFQRILQQAGPLVELEITESVIMKNPEHTAGRLRALGSLGVRFAVDDFGTGYSSLSYLRRFPINTLKIDRSFVQDIPASSEAGEIVKTVVALARALHLRTVAEGVENARQLAFLRTHGCNAVQGYLFARPLPVAAATRLLAWGTDNSWSKSAWRRLTRDLARLEIA